MSHGTVVIPEKVHSIAMEQRWGRSIWVDKTSVGWRSKGWKVPLPGRAGKRPRLAGAAAVHLDSPAMAERGDDAARPVDNAPV